MEHSNDNNLFATQESGRGREHYILVVVALVLMGGWGDNSGEWVVGDNGDDDGGQ
jgi:hypothetical protein